MKTPRDSSDFLVGVDVGQMNDFSAVIAFERTTLQSGKFSYELRHVDRVRGLSYVRLVERLDDAYRSTEMYGRATFVLDVTGVGRGVLDVMDEVGLRSVVVPVTITGGNEVAVKGRERSVPKSHLIANARALLEVGRARLPGDVPELPLLLDELRGFRVRYTANGRESYGNDARETPHDDLVLAMSLALWYGEHGESASGWMAVARQSAARAAAGGR